MLKIEAMTLANLAINSLFDPHQLVHKGIAVMFEEIKGKLVLVIDDPNE